MEEIDIATGLQSNGQKKAHKIQSEIQRTKIEYADNLAVRPLWKVLSHRLGLMTVVALSVTAAVGAWTFRQTPRYLGKFQLLIEPGQKNPPVNQLATENTVEYDTQIEVLRSPKILNPILQKISPQYKDLDPKNLAKKPQTKEEPLKITRLPQTKILEVTYEDEDPQKILFVLNNLADSYLKYGKEVRQTELKNAIEFVNIQLPKLQQKVTQYEGKLQKLRQQYNFLEPQQHANQLAQQLTDLETQFFDTQLRLKETTSLYQNLKKQIGLNTEEALTASYLSESPRYQHLLNQLQQVEIELAKESTVFVDDSPVIQTLKEKRANLQSLLKQESTKILGTSTQVNPSTPQLDSPSSVRLALNQQLVQSSNQLEVLQARSSVLEKQIQTLKNQIQQIPVIARQYTDIQRQISVATESVSRFLDAQEKIQLEAAQKVSPWELLSRPELAKNPIYPHPIRNLGLGMLGGILLGIIAAVVAEKIDNKFHTSEDIKEIIRSPILGQIPFQKNLYYFKSSQELAFLRSNLQPSLTASNLFKKEDRSFDRCSAFLEAFMSMYTNIYLLNSNQPLKSIVISSAITGEGKSTIALYLAQIAAVTGQRVLLVEANLRYPQYYQWIDVPEQQGLIEVLTSEIDLVKAIQKVPQWDNLSVLMVGHVSINPSQLLAGERMQQMMEQLHQDSEYDLVIYDTPSILSFPDAKIVAAATEGMVLVTKMGKTDRKSFKNCLDELTMSQITLLGLVANGVSRH